jgi:hypothetical protein
MHVAWRAQRSAQTPVAQGRALVESLIGRLLNIASAKPDAARQLTSLDLDEFIQTREGVLIPRQAVSQFFGGLLDPSAGALGVSDGGFLTPVDAIPLPEPRLLCRQG